MSEIDTGRDESRRGFLRTAGTVGVAAGVAAGAIGGDRAMAAGRKVKQPQLPDLYPGWNARNFAEIRADEQVHVEAITQAIAGLGGTPRPKPTFQNLAAANVAQFAIQSLQFENTGVGAYLGAAPAIFSREVLASAASIALVEAYHSGYLNTLLNTPIVPGSSPFAIPLTIDEVVARVTPFVAGLNGGPPPTFSTTPSASNDVAILNFALLLEYLEREFYDINVPRFFG